MPPEVLSICTPFFKKPTLEMLSLLRSRFHMKSWLLPAVLMLLFCSPASAQVGIGTTNPNPSAALEVTATTKGLLVPRYATTAISNITSPAKGLMVYDSTKNGFYVYSGSAWIAVGDNLGTHSATQNIKLNGNSISNDGSNNGLSIDAGGKVTLSSAAIANGGSTSDFLMKNNGSGDVGFRKGHGGLGMNYIIAIVGQWPSYPNSNNTLYTEQIIGEVRLFAGNYAPDGWMLCQGQTLAINGYQALFALLGTTYGGNGTNNFKLPDLRGTVPVGAGTATSGNIWSQGQKTD